MAYIARDATLEKLEAIEKKFREEEARARAEKESKRRVVGSLGKMGESRLAPAPLKSFDEQAEAAAEVEKENRLESVYREHAALVLEALNDPTEKRVRIAEALNAVKNETPITEPPDTEILATLEKFVLELRAQRKTAPTAPTTATPPPWVAAPVAARVPPPTPSRFSSPMTGREIKVPATKKK